jgi:LysM repeat protein
VQSILFLVGVTLGWLLLWHASPAAYAQTADQPHVLRIQVGGWSWVQVQVDERLAFTGILQQGNTGEWQGRQLTLTIASSAPVTVTLDGNQQRTLLNNGEGSAILRWPAVPPPPPVAPPTSAAPGQAPTVYVIQSGDTLALIAERFAVDLTLLTQVNQIADPNRIYAGQRLAIPGSDGALPAPALPPISAPLAGVTTTVALRGSVVERLTTEAQTAPASSPFHKTTWLTYYGRPGVPVMGILGEHEIAQLTPLLKAQAQAYDAANADELRVQGTFHLVYGMATKAPGGDRRYLAFLTDEVVEAYIQAAQAEKLAVILDIQIGALTPAEALAVGFPWLKYENVHLALDPEFAMAHQGQAWPGNPIGYVTAAQINEAQAAMQAYLVENNLPGERILLLHQFLDSIIVDKADLDWGYDRIALTISADGWGGPWGKISKYNDFIDEAIHFSAFKLFYRWDQPLMTPREALGIDGYGEQGYIEVTPNLIIYQ